MFNVNIYGKLRMCCGEELVGAIAVLTSISWNTKNKQKNKNNQSHLVVSDFPLRCQMG